MKKCLSLLALLAVFFLEAQIQNIKSGERLHYRIHYGVLNAGTATLSAHRTTYQGAPHLYVRGVGRSTGAVRAFFRVDDLYESYINLRTGLPSYYVRNVKEGGYSQHLHTAFNHQNHTLILTDKKTPSNGSKRLQSVRGIQDMLSAFYHLRNLDSLELRPGRTIRMNIWIDDEMFPFQLRVDRKEVVRTKFGRVNTLRITPMVMSGRVFKAKEGVTMWITDDKNHIPVMVEAELAVGSLKASLENYTSIQYPIAFRP